MRLNSGYSSYENFTDEEWVEKLLMLPPLQTLHRYFFKVKCFSFLQYVVRNILCVDSIEHILGEFYEFISRNNWNVLRKFRKDKNASLFTYLSRCTVRYFLKAKLKEDRNVGISLDSCCEQEYLSSFVDCEEINEDNRQLWRAFSRLPERDRLLLKALVIDEKPAIEIADDIWGYVDSRERDWRKLPAKRVQSTISMLKKRALYRLLKEMGGASSFNY